MKNGLIAFPDEYIEFADVVREAGESISMENLLKILARSFEASRCSCLRVGSSSLPLSVYQPACQGARTSSAGLLERFEPVASSAAMGSIASAISSDITDADAIVRAKKVFSRRTLLSSAMNQ